MNDPILITGCARSGTSLVSGIINICGAFGGDMSGPTLYNRKGMFENAEIRNQIVKPYLRLLGVDPMGQSPLPDIENLEPLPALQRQVETIITFQGYENGPWFYKGAKMCLIWPLWHQAFPKAKWVIVRRMDEDIAKSCLKTSFMRAHNTMEGWQGWIDEHKKRFVEMHAAGLDILEVWPAEFVDGNLSLIKHMIHQLGETRSSLKYDERELRNFITPNLWGSKHG